MALGFAVGANVAVLMFVDAICFRDAPVAEPARVVVLFSATPAGVSETFSFGTFRKLQAGMASVQNIGAEITRFAPRQEFLPRLTWGGDRVRLRATAVTAGYFETLGVRIRGRSFTPAEDLPGAPPVAVISDRFWHSRMKAEPAAIGSEVDFGAVRATIIGVAPSHFHGPRLGDDTDAWLCMAALPEATGISAEYLRFAGMTVYGRLHAGAQPADTALEAIRLMPPGADRVFGRRLADARYPAHLESRRADDSRLALLLAAASGLLFAAGWVNLVWLEVGRAERQRHTATIRAALGQTVGSLARATLADAAAIATIGCGVAVLVSLAATGLFSAVTLPGGLPASSLGLRPSGGIVAWVYLTCFATAALAGVVAVRRVRRDSYSIPLTKLAANFGRTRQGGVLAFQVAVATVLLIGSVMLWRSVRNAEVYDLGFDADEVVSIFIQPRSGQHGTQASRLADWDSLMRRVEESPSMFRATHGRLPLGSAALFSGVDAGTRVAGRDQPLRFSVGPGFSQAAGLRLLAGRDLEDPDIAQRPVPILATRSVTGRGGSPARVNDTLTLPPEQDPALARQTYRIVGIVQDAVRVGLRGRPAPSIFVPSAQQDSIILQGVVRVRGNAAQHVRRIETLAEELFPRATRLEVRTGANLVGEELSGARIGARLLLLFGGMSALLAFAGVLGLIGYAATKRQREMALRLALGAAPWNIATHLGRIAVLPVLLGLCAGVVAVSLLVSLFEAYLFGLGLFDLPSYAAGAGLVLAAAFCGVYWPTRRMLRLDPATLLRG
jgi:predicted permease